MAKSQTTSKKDKKKDTKTPTGTTETKPDEATSKPATDSKETPTPGATTSPPVTPPSSGDPPEAPTPEPIIEIDNKMMIDMVKDGHNTKRTLKKELEAKEIKYDEEQLDAKLAELSFLQAIIKFKKGQFWNYVPRPVRPLCYHCKSAKCQFIRIRKRSFPQSCQNLQYKE